MINMISTSLNSLLKKKQKSVLLFESVAGAQEIAFMLNGKWDGCNGVTVNKCDEVAINAAAALVTNAWCYSGVSFALLKRLTSHELLQRYAIGERNFINANLRCAELCSVSLSEANLSRASLILSDLSKSNLSRAILTAVDFHQSNLSDTNLSQSQLVRANLVSANLLRADLKEANLSYACLQNTNLREADLRGANLSGADLRGADLDGAIFDELELLKT
ncbi:MAG: pentapeptide repeat-containing protein [Rhizonema sp. PD37]|nr:pentapeptide repeat-containing protein [Rhizonema sp. PD37]